MTARELSSNFFMAALSDERATPAWWPPPRSDPSLWGGSLGAAEQPRCGRRPWPVGTGRLELPASRSQSERSTRLSYVPCPSSIGAGAALGRPRFANPTARDPWLLVLQKERAQTELAATGARPRRLMLTGLESLTPSERRVAEMAADPKTVEVHLSSVYRKLEISSRAQLPNALVATA